MRNASASPVVSSTRALGIARPMKDDAQKVQSDFKDSAKEVKHRTIAEAEHLKRDAFGDEMTTGEKLKSGANELRNRAAADIDKAKRDLRHSH
jgi:hypothetical protein